MKHPTEWTDDNLKSAILGNTVQREAAFAYLYQRSGWREWVSAHVRNGGGDKQEENEVFQQSAILFDRNIRQGRFEGRSTLRTYFYGIAKQVWYNIRRKQAPESLPTQESAEPVGDGIETRLIEEERKRIIDQIIHQMDDTCRKLLPLYMLSFSNEEIAKELDLSSAELAKKYAYRCRERFREFVLQRGWLQNLLNIRESDEK